MLHLLLDSTCLNEPPALLHLAVVCDLANGGQVLLEAVTFSAVRDRLTELGQVDHNGYNDTLAGTAIAPARDRSRTW